MESYAHKVVLVTIPNTQEEEMQKYVKESITHVHLDPHVLTTPGSFIDFNSLLLFIPVTYYYSPNDYPDGIPGIDIDKSIPSNHLTPRYLACGITAYNLTSNRVLWSHVFVRTFSHPPP